MSNQMDSKMQLTGKRKNNNNWAIKISKLEDEHI
jgi:hypothetical protein